MPIVKEINGQKMTFDVVLNGEEVALKVTHVDSEEVFGGLVAGVDSNGKLMRYVYISGDINLTLGGRGAIQQYKEGEKA